MNIQSFRTMLSAVLLAAATGVAAFVLSSAARAADAPKVSAPVTRLLTAAGTAAQAKDFKTALDDVRQAQALPNQTPFDTYRINQSLTYVAHNAGDDAAATTAAEAAADSPVMPDADKVAVTRNALVLAIQAKHNDKMKQYAKTLQDAGASDPTSLSAIMQGYYEAGDYADAETAAQKTVDTTPAGQKPIRNTLDILMSAQAQQKEEASAEKTLEMIALDYGQPSDWAQMIDIAFGTPGIRDIDVLYLGRLFLATGAPLSKSDADIIATTANKLTFYGDAAAGVAQGATPPPGLDAKTAADQKSMAAQIAAEANQNGQYSVKLAEALYGYGRYDDAEAAARAAIAKGGAADASEPTMVLGMILVAENKYGDAAQAFDQVTPPANAPALARIVRLWKGFAQSKVAAAAAPPTAAAKPN